MGWDSYIKIPAWKVLWKVSRHLQMDYLENFIENWDKLSQTLDDFDYHEVLEKKPTKLTSLDWGKIFNLLGKMISFDWETETFIFLMLLKRRGVEFEMVNDIDEGFDIEKFRKQGWDIREW